MALHVHPMVLSVAKEMANEWFEVYASDNRWYKAFLEAGGTERNARRQFVLRVAPRFYEEARKALAEVLNQDVPEYTKQQVFDALTKDNLMRANRTVDAERATVPKELH